ncbi:proline-rich protein 19 isoform X2 [Denticeps clupeoides]|uniref:proline-rich protein 19 isoform X2 n=1 Tax=Denticeps clupeoides TaxID=299321 RepID=UPI0010A2DFC2|nr:uncharacterized protein LOC114789764 isoform X2 [Denticeps clupeoides]
MSCPHSRQIKKGVSSTGSKHFRSQEKATVSISNAVPCCDRSDMAGTFPAQRKMKRLKTYKERSQIRDGQKLRQRHHSKAKGHSHGHSRGQSQFQTAVAKIFPHLKPCIITERRLVGHQGLFNHEVKSFDIERLLTKSKKGTRSDTRGIQNSKHKSSDSQVLMSPSNVGDSDGGIDCAASPENSIQHRASLHTANAGSIPQSAACGQALQRNHDALLKHVGKSLTSTQSDESPECCAKGEDSGASLIRKDCMALCSSESDPDPCCPSRTSAVSNSTMKSRANTAVPEVSRTFKVKEQCSQQALKPQPAIPLDLTPGSHPSIGDGSLTSDGTQRELLRADSKEVSRQQQVSMVAARLCQSLKMPRRKHLLDETRGVLLQALRERHGAQIQENMLNLQRHLFEQGQNNRGHISLGKTPALDDQCIGTGQDCMEQPHLDSQRKPYCNRRRKQPCPQRRSPLPLAFTPQHSSERHPGVLNWELKRRPLSHR